MGKRPFSFHKLGFQRNPFGVVTDEEWVTLAVLPDGVEALLFTADTHLQLLGPAGAGKTTCLLWLADRLTQVGQRAAYEYLAPGERTLRTKTADLDVLVLDEAQRLGWWPRRRLFSSLRQHTAHPLRLFLSSHRDLRPHFRRRGLSLVTVDLGETGTAAHHARVWRRRLATFALPGAPHATLSDDAFPFLAQTFGSDLRAAEYFLYEVWQGLERVEVVTAVKLSRIWDEYRQNQ